MHHLKFNEQLITQTEIQQTELFSSQREGFESHYELQHVSLSFKSMFSPINFVNRLICSSTCHLSVLYLLKFQFSLAKRTLALVAYIC